MNTELLKELCETPAIPGREQALIDIMVRELRKTCDKVEIDDLGNVLGYKKGTKPGARKIMIAAHMDEIGFVVSHIDKNGFLRFSPRGGHVPRVLVSQRVKILGRKTLIGVVEGSPAFLKREDMQKTPEIKDLFIDTGLPEKDVHKQVAIGDAIVLDREFLEQGDICMAKAFDDRVGCYVILETMKRLKRLPVNVYVVGTTQEEVGVRGAFTATRGIIPDIGIALDVTAAFDVPGVAEHEHVSQLGNGVAIKIADASTISNHGIVKNMQALARKHRIKHQLEILPFGGTDAMAMQRHGNGAVCTLSVPARYVHSPNEIIHKKDLEATIALLVKFIEASETCKLEF
jgi:putative aminopeptidase FrvX